MISVAKMLPPSGVGRALALQSAIYAVGSGLFLAGSAVFFTQVVGLTPAQVGVGLSVAGLVSMTLGVPLGWLTDRVGARRVWLAAMLGEVLLYMVYPFVRGFGVFVIVVVVLAAVEGTGASGRTIYTLEVVPREDRVRVLAFQRSALNVGFTVGAGLAGVALLVDTREAYLTLPLGYAAIMLINVFFVRRLPKAPGTHTTDTRRSAFAVFKDAPFMLAVALSSILSMISTIYMVAMPLWIIQRTDAPKSIVAWLLMLNTILVVFLQVPTSRGTDEPAGSGRAFRRAGIAMAAGCAVLALTQQSAGTTTIVALCAAAIALTFAEMFQAAGAWGINAQLPPADRRGQYLGAARTVGQLQRVIAPATLTTLTTEWHGLLGWLLIGALATAAGCAAAPAVAWADRTRVQRPARS